MALQIMEKVGSGFQKESDLLTERMGRLQSGIREQLLQYSNRMNNLNLQLHRIGLEKVRSLQRNLDRNMSMLTIRVSSVSADKRRSLQNIGKLLKNSAGHKQRRIGQSQKMMEEKLKAFDPQRVLERGYSITLHQGRVVRDSKQLKEDDRITTVLKKGKLESIIKRTKHGN
jgi:exodeoxyribonuclease VII large subunit